jgi:UDP-N-acetyl-alpha-D-muramoyl-L-alanyl-L-glutamate epimerase
VTKYQAFSFDGYDFDPSSKKLELNYSLDDQVHFTETYRFNFDFTTYNAAALDRAIFGLLMMAGVSYYKSALPPQIKLKTGLLTPDQASFFEQTYRYGLGEFFFQNNLDPNMPINFPVDTQAKAVAGEIEGLDGSLVPVGGGKDSIVTAELLLGAGKDFAAWRVGDSGQLQDVLDQLGRPHFEVRRTVSPELLKMNSEGALNGHVPITAILSFLAVVCAILSGRKNVIFSNEWSAGEGNTVYKGVEINHQYSKSFAFEQAFQAYLEQNISPSLQYFSLLRPLSELKIAEIFCTRYLETYVGKFSSCNRNFHLESHQTLNWCGKCSKCAFVFLIFAPFVPKKQLTELFGGRNLFKDPELTATFNELLGLSGQKPFECVGEINECRQALLMAHETGDYPELAQYHVPDPQFDPSLRHPSAMPLEFSEITRVL